MTSRDLTSLTAWDIYAEKRLDQELRGSFPLYRIVEGKVVITSLQLSSMSSIYVWDLSSNQLQHIESSGVGSASNLILCHMDVAKNMLVAFQVSRYELPPKVWQTKWSTTTEQLLERKMIFDLPMPDDRPVCYRDSEPWRTYGHRTVAQLFFATANQVTLHFEYDGSVDRLSFRWINCAEPMNAEFPRKESAYLTPNLFYHFSTTTGQFAIYNTRTGTATLRTAPLRASYAIKNYSSWKWIRQQWQGATPFDPPFSHVCGDREAFGFANAIGVQLWFFNENFAPDFLPDGVYFCDRGRLVRFLSPRTGK